MQGRSRFRCMGFSSVLVLLLSAVPGRAATPTPTFTISATNVSLSGQGTSASQFTLTSVNGFSGQVGIVCSGPDPNLFQDLVLPSCSNPTQLVTVPANGTASGSMKFYPPWENSNEAMRNGRDARLSAAPVLGGLFAGTGLLGLGLRRRLHGRLALVLCALGMGLLSGAIGCLGHGGLEMTPGTYAYTLSGAGPAGAVSKSINVTVHCDSCP